jgi:hypothetical protein
MSDKGVSFLKNRKKAYYISCLLRINDSLKNIKEAMDDINITHQQFSLKQFYQIVSSVKLPKENPALKPYLDEWLKQADELAFKIEHPNTTDITDFRRKHLFGLFSVCGIASWFVIFIFTDGLSGLKQSTNFENNCSNIIDDRYEVCRNIVKDYLNIVCAEYFLRGFLLGYHYRGSEKLFLNGKVETYVEYSIAKRISHDLLQQKTHPAAIQLQFFTSILYDYRQYLFLGTSIIVSSLLKNTLFFTFDAKDCIVPADKYSGPYFDQRCILDNVEKAGDEGFALSIADGVMLGYSFLSLFLLTGSVLQKTYQLLQKASCHFSFFARQKPVEEERPAEEEDIEAPLIPHLNK